MVGNNSLNQIDKFGLSGKNICKCVKIKVTRTTSFPSGTFGHFELFLNGKVEVFGVTREPAVGGPRGNNSRTYPIPGKTYHVHVGETQWSTFGKGLLFNDSETSPFKLIRFHMPIGNNEPVDSRQFPIAGKDPDDTGALGKGCIWVGSHFEVYSDIVSVPHFPKGYPYRNFDIPGYTINRHAIFGGESTLRAMVDTITKNCGSKKVETEINEAPTLLVPPNFKNIYSLYTYTVN